jgi:hypothetical protein
MFLHAPTLVSPQVSGYQNPILLHIEEAKLWEERKRRMAAEGATVSSFK